MTKSIAQSVFVMFTVQFINSLPTKDAPYKEYEKATRSGFGVQVSPKGTKSFLMAYKVTDEEGKRKQRFMKLGVVGKMSLKEAGQEWQKWYNVKQEGFDPQTVRNNQIRESEEAHRRAEETKKELERQGSYAQLLEGYVAYLRSEGKRSADNVEQVLNANAYKVIGKSVKANDVSADSIDDTLLIVEKRGAHVLVNRLRSYLSAAFNFGIKSDKRRGRSKSKAMFGITSNPVREVLKSDVKESKGERHLSEDEVKRLWSELPQTAINKKTIAALKLMIATGQREEEVLRMNKKSIDAKSMLWELDKTKNGKPQVIPLPDIALEIIEGLDSNRDGYFFVSAVTKSLIKTDSVSQSCGRFCKKMDFEKFTPRDLRRTWKTLAGKAGITKFDRDRYQNHAMNDVSSEHYDRYDYLAEKRQVAVIWNEYLTGILTDEDSNIIPLKRKA